MRQMQRAFFAGSLFLFLGLFLLAGCGSNATAGGASGTAGAAATATACAQLTRTPSSTRTALGTVKSISGQTFVLTDQRGTAVTVTYTSSTRFTQEVTVPASSLQEGTPVRVVVSNNAGTYTATSIVVTGATTGGGTTGGFPGFPRGNGTPGAGRASNPCFARARAGNGTPGAGTNNTTNFRGLVGTVSHLSGNVLTITDSSGADYTVNITAQTQIVETKNTTAAALKVGQALTVTGRTSGQGEISASLVAILLSLPTRSATPTPTP
jgi:hypothetical protein